MYRAAPGSLEKDLLSGPLRLEVSAEHGGKPPPFAYALVQDDVFAGLQHRQTGGSTLGMGVPPPMSIVGLIRAIPTGCRASAARFIRMPLKC